MMVAFNSRMKIGSASTGTAHEADLPPSAVNATTTASLSFPGMSGSDTTTGIGAGTNGTGLISSSGESSYPTTGRFYVSSVARESVNTVIYTFHQAEKDVKSTTIGTEDAQAVACHDSPMASKD